MHTAGCERPLVSLEEEQAGASIRTPARSLLLLYRRRKRCHARLAHSWAFRWTRGSLATLAAPLRTFGFLSTSAALWRSFAVRLASSSSSFLRLPSFFLLNKGRPSFLLARLRLLPRSGGHQHPGVPALFMPTKSPRRPLPGDLVNKKRLRYYRAPGFCVCG